MPGTMMSTDAPSFYELAVMTRPAVLAAASPGHAMIVIAAPGKRVEAWGFHPGGIRDEVVEGGWQRYTRSAVITLTPEQYRTFRTTLQVWRSKGSWPLYGYSLTTTDCVGFAYEVLKSAGIEVRDRKLLPDDFGAEVVKAHGESWGMCLARTAQPRTAPATAARP